MKLWVILLNILGNVERLASSDTVSVKPIETKTIEVSLEEARLGRLIGKKGIHIKALSQAYNVTARITRTANDTPGRRKMIFDSNVKVLVSAPTGHDQDILKFEKAFVEHVEIVKKKEKKHKEEVINSVVYSF